MISSVLICISLIISEAKWNILFNETFLFVNSHKFTYFSVGLFFMILGASYDFRFHSER